MLRYDPQNSSPKSSLQRLLESRALLSKPDFQGMQNSEDRCLGDNDYLAVQPTEDQKLNLAEKAVLVAMTAVNLGLTGFFFSRTGVKSYLIIYLFMAFGWVFGCFLALKRGLMLGRGLIIRRHDNPVRFYLNMAVLVGMFIIMSLFFVGLFLQETGYLPRIG